MKIINYLINLCRYIIPAAVAIAIVVDANAQNIRLDSAKQGSVVISGKLGTLNPPKQLWYYIGKEKWDTIPVIDGAFRLTKKTLLPNYGAIMVKYKQGGSFFANTNLMTTYFEAGELNIKSDSDSLTKAIFSGSASHLQNQYLSQRQQAAAQRMSLVGKPYISFTGEMPNGQLFNSESLKGKVFLIDFWGSWCVYCRKGHPHLKTLYSKYKDKGFEIIGIGSELTKTREEGWIKFKKAIAEDNLPWLQILNDRTKRDLPKDYHVNAYPTKILVDKNGKILLRVTDDNERRIDATLKDIFGF